MIGQWIMFENDICEGCEKPKVAKLTFDSVPGTDIQCIISCECDGTVFDHQWKGAKDRDELIVVVESTVMDMVKMLSEQIGKKKP